MQTSPMPTSSGPGFLTEPPCFARLRIYHVQLSTVSMEYNGVRKTSYLAVVVANAEVIGARSVSESSLGQSTLASYMTNKLFRSLA